MNPVRDVADAKGTNPYIHHKICHAGDASTAFSLFLIWYLAMQQIGRVTGSDCSQHVGVGGSGCPHHQDVNKK
jgi:hypothetical protein